jgi:peptidoglycan/LPS O-acetylase OafA/YrhL
MADVAGAHGWADLGSAVQTVGRFLAYAPVGLGFHGVGLFLIVSGWSLTQSCAKQARAGAVSWPGWYRKKLLRLFPMYWVAHLVYLACCLASYLTGRTVLVDQFEPVDGRLWYSLSGLRVIDIDSNFFYINAAWWYFTLLIQLYLLFPLLFACLRRFGVARFFLGACAVGLGLRYLMLAVAPYHEAFWGFSNGSWIQGGFGLCRVPEFALGMGLGIWHQKHPERVERFLLGGPGLLLGAGAYPFALRLYGSLNGYVLVDLCTGLCFFLLTVGIAGLVGGTSRLGRMFAICGAYSYGIYLLHQPHIIFLGLRIGGLPPAAFAAAALAGIAAVSVVAIVIEKAVNSLVERFLALAVGRVHPAVR